MLLPVLAFVLHLRNLNSIAQVSQVIKFIVIQHCAALAKLKFNCLPNWLLKQNRILSERLEFDVSEEFRTVEIRRRSVYRCE